jgi:hypothetical protein
MEVKVADTINYAQSVSRISKYKHSKILPISGAPGGAVTIGVTSQTTTFELPIQTYNFAESYLSFGLTVPADKKVFRNILPFERVELYSRGGVYLADITNSAQWSVATLSHNKKVGDFLASTNDLLRPISNADSKVQLTATAGNYVFQISGKELEDTIFALDKSVFMAEVINLRITWLNRDGLGFTSAGGPILADIPITNLSYNLAVEQNSSVDSELKNQVMSTGMSLLFPSSFMFRNAQAIGNNHNLSIRLGRGNGVSLERIYTTAFGVEANATRYTPVTANILSLYSLLDSKRQQEFDVSIAAEDDRMLLKRMTHDKVYGMYDNRDTMFAWEESWCDGNRGCANEQVNTGLSLDNEKKYDLYIAVNNIAASYYTVAVCQRQLMLTPQGVRVM